MSKEKDELQQVPLIDQEQRIINQKMFSKVHDATKQLNYIRKQLAQNQVRIEKITKALNNKKKAQRDPSLQETLNLQIKAEQEEIKAALAEIEQLRQQHNDSIRLLDEKISAEITNYLPNLLKQLDQKIVDLSQTVISNQLQQEQLRTQRDQEIDKIEKTSQAEPNIDSSVLINQNALMQELGLLSKAQQAIAEPPLSFDDLARYLSEQEDFDPSSLSKESVLSYYLAKIVLADSNELAAALHAQVMQRLNNTHHNLSDNLTTETFSPETMTALWAKYAQLLEKIIDSKIKELTQSLDQESAKLAKKPNARSLPILGAEKDALIDKITKEIQAQIDRLDEQNQENLSQIERIEKLRDALNTAEITQQIKNMASSVHYARPDAIQQQLNDMVLAAVDTEEAKTLVTSIAPAENSSLLDLQRTFDESDQQIQIQLKAKLEAINLQEQALLVQEEQKQQIENNQREIADLEKQLAQNHINQQSLRQQEQEAEKDLQQAKQEYEAKLQQIEGDKKNELVLKALLQPQNIQVTQEVPIPENVQVTAQQQTDTTSQPQGQKSILRQDNVRQEGQNINIMGVPMDAEIDKNEGVAHENLGAAIAALGGNESDEEARKIDNQSRLDQNAQPPEAQHAEEEPKVENAAAEDRPKIRSFYMINDIATEEKSNDQGPDPDSAANAITHHAIAEANKHQEFSLIADAQEAIENIEATDNAGISEITTKYDKGHDDDDHSEDISDLSTTDGDDLDTSSHSNAFTEGQTSSDYQVNANHMKGPDVGQGQHELSSQNTLGAGVAHSKPASHSEKVKQMAQNIREAISNFQTNQGSNLSDEEAKYVNAVLQHAKKKLSFSRLFGKNRAIKHRIKELEKIAEKLDKLQEDNTQNRDKFDTIKGSLTLDKNAPTQKKRFFRDSRMNKFFKKKHQDLLGK